MNDRARNNILERRARFVAAAAVIVVAACEPACEPQVCLSTAPQCDADQTQRYVVEGPSTLCVGERGDVRYVLFYCDQRTEATRDTKFTSSDPGIASVENNGVVRALGVGRAVITGNFIDNSGESATLTIEVSACADAATDARDDG